MGQVYDDAIAEHQEAVKNEDGRKLVRIDLELLREARSPITRYHRAWGVCAGMIPVCY